MTDISKTNWRLVGLIWLAGLGAAAQYGKISVIFGRLPDVYPQAGTALGFAVSLVGAVGIVLGVVAGVFVASIGYRRALLGGLLVGAGASALQAAFPPLPVFLASRVVEGAAHLAIVVAAPTMIAQITQEKDRGFALTLWGTFFGVAFAVLSFAGVALAEARGLAALMWAHAGYMFAAALLLWPILPQVVDAPKVARFGAVMAAHRRIYASPAIGAAALGWLFYTACFVSTLTLLPPFLAAEHRAWVMTALPLMSILSSLTIGVWALRYTGAVAVIVTGFVLSMAVVLGLIAAPGLPALVLALGAALGLVQGASFAAVAQLNAAPEDRALANGGLAQMGNLGNTMGTPVMVAIIAIGGHAGFMVSLALLFVLGAAVHLWLSHKRKALI